MAANPAETFLQTAPFFFWLILVALQTKDDGDKNKLCLSGLPADYSTSPEALAKGCFSFMTY